MKNILVVGGAGYIGSQTVKHLCLKGYNAIVYDDLSSGHKEAIFGCKLIVGDISNKRLISQVIRDEKIDAVMNFAGLIDVGQSIKEPSNYINNNCVKAVNLIQAMLENGVYNIIFSSTAAVYGNPKMLPIKEEDPLIPTNPYGLSKYLFEKTLKFYQNQGLKYVSLRYFNAAGADVSARLGEDHKNKTHLITLAILTALGLRDNMYLFGTDYETDDGTCIRDYVHVADLADAHILALEFLAKQNKSSVFNLGNGKGFSNRQVIEVVKKVSGNDFAVIETNKREGDPKELIASSKKAMKVLGWKPRYVDLRTIVKTAYDWHRLHPEGFGCKSKRNKELV